MEDSTTNAPPPSMEAEVAEELALHHALKRTRLEEAARSPTISSRSWMLYVLLGGVLIYFQDHLAEYIWLIALVLLIEINSRTASVHARIDAILELEKMGKANPSGKLFKNAEQDAPSNGG